MRWVNKCEKNSWSYLFKEIKKPLRNLMEIIPFFFRKFLPNEIYVCFVIQNLKENHGSGHR